MSKIAQFVVTKPELITVESTAGNQPDPSDMHGYAAYPFERARSIPKTRDNLYNLKE